MYLPRLNKFDVKRKVIDSFGGINKCRVCKEEQFYDTEGLSTYGHPALATAPPVYELDSFEVGSVADPVFFLNQGLGYIAARRPDLPDVYTITYDGTVITNFAFKENVCVANTTAFNDKTLFVKGNMAYEFDPNYTSKAEAMSVVGYSFNIQAAHEKPEYNEITLRLSLMYEDMTEIGNFIMGTENEDFPDDAEVGDCFARYMDCYRLIYKGSRGDDIWQPVTSFRLRLNIGDGYARFKEGDYIQLKGLKYWNWSVRHFDELDRFLRIDIQDTENRYITEAIPVFKDFFMVLEKIVYPTNDIGYNKPIINNYGNDLYLLEGSVSACMPEMDFICTGANRVWGCSNTNREIYASELGNARNWSVFEGLSGDSYAVTVGSSGDFTACCNYLGTPVFFKENEMIVVTGSRPSSFTLNSYSIRGVPKDSPDGVAVVSDKLYFMTHDGVYVYNGSSAQCVSEELGEDIKNLRNVILGGEGDTLYVSGFINDKYIQYTYDTLLDIWHSSTCDKVVGYIRYPDATLQITHSGTHASIRTMKGSIPRDYDLVGAARLDDVWHWETGDISFSTTDKKYVRRIGLDTRCEGTSELYISYDGGGFEHIGSFAPHTRGSNVIYVFPKRCDHFRLRMEGEGEMTLYTLIKDIEEAREDG